MEQFTSEDRQQIKDTLAIVVKIDTALRGNEYGGKGIIKIQEEHEEKIGEMYPAHLSREDINKRLKNLFWGATLATITSCGAVIWLLVEKLSK
jgi:hypothetical protein